MNKARSRRFNWIWPSVGPTPINQGLDSEMFDRTDFPYHRTFVREAIQNSLDARLELDKPVTVNFTFHSEGFGPRRAYLEEVITHRKKVGLGIPREWENGCVKWLVVEDFNSTGLCGDLGKRTSDFWNYWLNFGLSNKDGSGRGGRGIGRVTFLIASQLQTVIGYTRRHTDQTTAICGMCVLRAKEDGEDVLSTHAYLAQGINGNIYRLYNSEEFSDQTRKAFVFTGFDGEFPSGLGLAILYPHQELEPEGILASAIENFAPAIMTGTLRLNVDGVVLDALTIDEVAREISEEKWSDDAIRGAANRYLSLIERTFKETQRSQITLPNAYRSDFDPLRNSDPIKSLQEKIAARETVVLEVRFPLERHGTTSMVQLCAGLTASPSGTKPIDRLFREGMSLPDVRTRNPGELDLVLLVDGDMLATYLNFCEGKAHLDLLESKDVRQKLTDHGFSDVRVKRLVKSLPTELRSLLTPDITEPDAHVFDAFFSIPTGRKGADKRPRSTDDPPPSPPPPKPPVFRLHSLDDGLRLSANPEYPDWPVNVTIDFAYADGTRRPSWSPFDFRLEDLTIDYENCEMERGQNRIRLLDCGSDAQFEITGFDANRELDTTIRARKHEKAD